MAEEEKPTQTGSQTDTSSEQRTQDEARAAKPSSLTADAEKDAQVEAAKARVAAVKEAAQAAQAAPGAPRAPVKKKEEGPKPVDASAHPLVEKLAQSSTPPSSWASSQSGLSRRASSRFAML